MVNSICFSSVLADMLNEKAHKIDPRLYLFAYYEPKPLVTGESPRIQFLTAVINLYGLLWDCGPFVHKSLMRSVPENPLENILPDTEWANKRHIVFHCKDLANIVGHFRSVFCHNNSDKFALNREHIEKVEDWLYHKCRLDCPYDELTQNDWRTMLSKLVDEADQFVADINDCLDTLLDCRGSSRFEVACDSWLKAIARNYVTNPELLLNAMVDFYQLYLTTIKAQSKNNYSFRHYTIRWIVDNFSVERDSWFSPWLGAVKDLENSKVYQLIKDWQKSWEAINPSCIGTPCEAAMPASSFFLVLADDVYKFAQNPNTEFNPS